VRCVSDGADRLFTGRLRRGLVCPGFGARWQPGVGLADLICTVLFRKTREQEEGVALQEQPER
jgi:hypothetical protein